MTRKFSDYLDQMNRVVMDTESFGINTQDDIYSFGYRNTYDGKIVDKEFHIKTSTNRPNNITDLDGIEKWLADKHSSSSFGNAQKERGSLKSRALAEKENRTITLSSAMDNLADDIFKSNKGTILTGQNLIGFEGRMLSDRFSHSEVNQGLKNSPGARYIANSNFMGNKKPSKILNILSADSSIIDARDNLRKTYTNLIKSKDSNSILKNKNLYGEAGDNLAKSLLDTMHNARMTSGLAVIDQMDMTRALYAQGVRAGTIDPHFSKFGTSMDFFSKLIRDGASEQHEALADSILQDDVFKIVSKELDEHLKNPNYQSDFLKKVNDKLKNSSEINETFKKGLSQRLIEDLHKNNGNIESVKNNLDSEINKSLSYYDEVPENHLGFNRTKYAKSLSDTVKNISNESSKENFISAIEQFADNFKSPATVTPNSKYNESFAKVSTFMKNKNAKKLAIGGGLLFAADLAFGGSKEDKVKYNTYDEVYNNQYYGSGFADWQNRNNAHKLLY